MCRWNVHSKKSERANDRANNDRSLAVSLSRTGQVVLGFEEAVGLYCVDIEIHGLEERK